MKVILEKLIINYPYLIAVVLFVIGILTVLTRSNLFKKLIGINIMESAVFILFVAGGNIRGGEAPILDGVDSGSLYINPLPSALMLTGIVVSVSVTAFALSLIVRLYKTYGTTDIKKIEELTNIEKLKSAEKLTNIKKLTNVEESTNIEESRSIENFKNMEKFKNIEELEKGVTNK